MFHLILKLNNYYLTIIYNNLCHLNILYIMYNYFLSNLFLFNQMTHFILDSQ